MAFQTAITIYDTIYKISISHFLLPAIQRDFKWPHWKIEWLFDSLMRGYPISSLLFWEVRGETKKAYKFYHFLREFRQDFRSDSKEADITGDFIAILDGQQRLTSLYIGLKGSFAYRIARGRKDIDDENSRPTRLLYINISRMLDENDEEDGRVYEFSFLTNIETKQHDLHVKKNKIGIEERWFRVGKILDLIKPEDLYSFITNNDISGPGIIILNRLYTTIFTDRSINFFLETSADLQKALNIFIRINSGGMPLDFSDLVMSIVVSNWKKKDAKNAIPGLINEVKEIGGFIINKEFIFKTFLYLYNTDIRFKVTNFRQKNAKKLEDEWENIRDAIKHTFRLMKSFGFSDSTLTSKYAVIPVIFYLYHLKIYDTFRDLTAYKTDRNAIRQWMHIVLIKRIFGGNDAVLSHIRQAFLSDKAEERSLSGSTEETIDDSFTETDNVEIFTPKFMISTELTAFPVEKISEKIRRDLSIGDDFITDLLHTQKDDKYAFSILALLFPQMDYKNNDFHKDHLHPQAAFTDLDTLSLTQQDREYYTPYWFNSIINLQMLDANDNMRKQSKPLTEWIDIKSKEDLNGSVAEARNQALIPNDASLLFKDFAQFAQKRKVLLAEKLKVALGN